MYKIHKTNSNNIKDKIDKKIKKLLAIKKRLENEIINEIENDDIFNNLFARTQSYFLPKLSY